MEAKKHATIPRMSDKYNTQVEASIKAKGQLYCYLSVARLLSKVVVGPAHLETICSQNGIGQQEAMFYRLVGASLSEPHTSVTALRTRVCMLVGLFGPTTYRNFEMSAFKIFHDDGMSTPTCTSANN